MHHPRIAGNVLSCRRLPNEKLEIVLIMDGARHIVRYAGTPITLAAGDYIWSRDDAAVEESDHALHCDELSVLQRSRKIPRDKSGTSTHHQTDSARLERLRLRSLGEQIVSDYMGHHGFLRVTSPAIVGQWPDGRTIPFTVDYYGCAARLSISNMIYQQIMALHGFGKLYEIGKSFRNETPSRRNRLAEYTTFDITRAAASMRAVEEPFEQLVCTLLESLRRHDWQHLQLPERVWFERIRHQDLMRACGETSMQGAQLPGAARQYIAQHFHSYVWITNFPEATRPFYAKSDGVHCEDSQLWYRGKIYVAAGNLIETDIATYLPRMIARGQDPNHFKAYLEHIRMGVPPMAQLAVGLERLFGTWFDEADPADFAWFPRYGKTIAL